MKHITFHFDVVSPYAYLAFEKLPQALQGLSYEVAYRPVLFAGFLKHHGQLGPAEIAPKRDWTYRQVLWLANAHGIPLQMPAGHPFNPLPLLRLALACGAGPQPNRYICETVFRHLWRGGADASAPERSREDIELAMCDYMVREAAAHGTHWYSIAPHMLGLRNGLPGARRWRQVWSDHRLKALAPHEVMARAHDAVPQSGTVGA